MTVSHSVTLCMHFATTVFAFCNSIPFAIFVFCNSITDAFSSTCHEHFLRTSPFPISRILQNLLHFGIRVFAFCNNITSALSVTATCCNTIAPITGILDHTVHFGTTAFPFFSRTATVWRDLEPFWGEEYAMFLPVGFSNLSVYVYDEDTIG